jgi:signal peptidase I
MRRRKRQTPAWLEFLETLALAFVLALLVRTFVLESYQVSGYSMEPTLQNGERVLVNKMIFHFESPKPGEIVVFRSPVIPSQDWIKRVIAVPGETVAIHSGHVYINGHYQPEPFIKYKDPSSNYRQVKVPPGYLFVMGDNRPDSYDSRYFGFLSESLLRGEAFVVWWPLNHFRGL